MNCHYIMCNKYDQLKGRCSNKVKLCTATKEETLQYKLLKSSGGIDLSKKGKGIGEDMSYSLKSEENDRNSKDIKLENNNMIKEFLSRNNLNGNEPRTI